MAQALNLEQSEKSSSVLDRLGIPRPLALSFLGVLLFMIGDGVESGYLSPYLISRGLTLGNVALMITIYGFVVAFAAWCSGALSDLWGPRQVMLIGAVVWAVFEVIFLVFGIATVNYPVMLVAYGLRGFGYPLFAFGFLVWIAAATPQRRLGSAVGWFWFAFTGGLPTLGSLIASFVIPAIGAFNTFWVALGLVVLGALLALLGVRERIGSRPLVAPGAKPIATLLSSITIAWKKPKTAIGCIVRAINTAPELGFLVFLPIFFTQTLGFSLGAWLRLLSIMFLSNIIWNLLFGIIGDKLGWRQTVAYCGGIGCAITTLALYYVPITFRGDYSLALLMAILYGATLAGYVPLSALMPSLAPENKGAAMSPSLYPDVLPTLTTLASRYRLGIVADSPTSAMEALRRDGLDKLLTVIAISDVVGMEKPDPRLYQYALDKASVRADRTVHVGNRLDLDVRPARRLGMRTVWVPRGEVPPAPTREQFAEADAVVITLAGLPTALARMTGDPTRLSA